MFENKYFLSAVGLVLVFVTYSLLSFIEVPWGVRIEAGVYLIFWALTLIWIIYSCYWKEEQLEWCLPFFLGGLFAAFIPVLDYKAGRSTAFIDPMIRDYGFSSYQLSVAAVLILVGFLLVFVKRRFI